MSVLLPISNLATENLTDDSTKDFVLFTCIKKLEQLGWLVHSTEKSETGLHTVICQSEVYLGQIIGKSGVSLLEAYMTCINLAQRYIASEKSAKHDYSYDILTQSVQCRHCGFQGYKPLFGTITQQRKVLEKQMRLPQLFSILVVCAGLAYIHAPTWMDFGIILVNCFFAWFVYTITFRITNAVYIGSKSRQ